MVAEPPPGGALDDDEHHQLATLLARYVSHEMDQFDHWKIDTPYGLVFVQIGYYPAPGASPEAYDTMWPPRS